MFDGANSFFAPIDQLMELVVPNSVVARLQSGEGVSPSAPDCITPQASIIDRWEWLTPSGLAQAQSATVPLPPKAVPHLVGKGGATIRMIENLIGVIIGVIDGHDGQASVSLVGPQHSIDAARPLIQAVAGGGAWSLLRRIHDRGPLFA